MNPFYVFPVCLTNALFCYRSYHYYPPTLIITKDKYFSSGRSCRRGASWMYLGLTLNWDHPY